MIRIPTLFALTLAACGTPEVEIEPEEIAQLIFDAAQRPVLNGSVIHAHLGQIER